MLISKPVNIRDGEGRSRATLSAHVHFQWVSIESYHEQIDAGNAEIQFYNEIILRAGANKHGDNRIASSSQEELLSFV